MLPFLIEPQIVSDSSLQELLQTQSVFYIYGFFALLLGLALGSFINVCVYRIPLKKSIVSPPSSCPQCGKEIRFYDNIPIISYIILLGKCRNCGHHISWQYPAVELLTGVLSMGLFIKYGFTFQYFLYFLFSASLLTVSFIDIRHQIIPDVISLSGIILGLLASFIPGNLNWLESLAGIIAGGGFLYLVAVIYERLTGKMGMGGGDIKLLAMIGAWLGWRSIFPVIMLSSLAGSIIGSAMIFLAGKGLKLRIPFGPFLSIAAIVYLFSGQELLSWYLELF